MADAVQDRWRGDLVIPLARRAAGVLLRSDAVKWALRTLATARGHRLVLVYHRLGPPAPPGCEVVPSVQVDAFRAHLQALGEVVDLVTIDDILGSNGDRPRGRRPAVALTFDDDLVSHPDAALPALRDFQVPGAFFLSGRALHGFGAYWFQQLEAVLVKHGEQQTAALLGVPTVPSGGLLAACEADPTARARIRELAADLPSPAVLSRSAIGALADAGMTIGFHTLDHEVLPALNDDRLRDAIVRGRDDLAGASGTPVRYFAYPHGKADQRVAAAVRAAGFEAAFTGHPRPLGDHGDRCLLGRWEPGPLGVDELLVRVAVRLHRAAPARPGQPR